MAGNLTALQATWATLTGPTVQKLAVLNSMMVPGPPQDVTITIMENFLISHNLLQPVTDYVAKGTNPSALIGCNYFLALLAAGDPVIHTSIPANFAAVQQIGAGLLADSATGFTQQHLVEMIGLIATPMPWWQANGFSGSVTVTDLIAAGDLF